MRKAEAAVKKAIHDTVGHPTDVVRPGILVEVTDTGEIMVYESQRFVEGDHIMGVRTRPARDEAVIEQAQILIAVAKSSLAADLLARLVSRLSRRRVA